MRASSPTAKIIYFTAKVEVKDFQGNLKGFSQADAVIEKPASSEKIIHSIQQVLSN